MTAFDLPDPIRRRLGLPCAANPVIAEIKQGLFANAGRYIALVLEASAGNEVDFEELLSAAQRAGKTPARVNFDLEVAATAYAAWRNSVDP